MLYRVDVLGKVWSRGKTDYRLAWNVSEYIPLPNY